MATSMIHGVPGLRFFAIFARFLGTFSSCPQEDKRHIFLVSDVAALKQQYVNCVAVVVGVVIAHALLTTVHVIDLGSRYCQPHYSASDSCSRVPKRRKLKITPTLQTSKHDDTRIHMHAFGRIPDAYFSCCYCDGVLLCPRQFPQVHGLAVAGATYSNLTHSFCIPKVLKRARRRQFRAPPQFYLGDPTLKRVYYV